MWQWKLSVFKLLPGEIDKPTERVINWKSHTKSQWASNWSKHSNCIVYEIFLVEDLFRCGHKVNRYLYVSYWQRYEWSKYLQNTNKLSICFFSCKVCIKQHKTKDNKEFVFLFWYVLQKLSNIIYYTRWKVSVKCWNCQKKLSKKYLSKFLQEKCQEMI